MANVGLKKYGLAQKGLIRLIEITKFVVRVTCLKKQLDSKSAMVLTFKVFILLKKFF